MATDISTRPTYAPHVKVPMDVFVAGLFLLVMLEIKLSSQKTKALVVRIKYLIVRTIIDL